jgi:hypothetical protein
MRGDAICRSVQRGFIFTLPAQRWATALAPRASHGEYRVKAAFLLSIARLVEWPSSSFQGKEDPVIIAVLGAEPFESGFEEAIRGESVGRRVINLDGLVNNDIRAYILDNRTSDYLTSALIRVSASEIRTRSNECQFSTRSNRLDQRRLSSVWAKTR